MSLSHPYHPLMSRRTMLQAGSVGLLGLGMYHVAALPCRPGTVRSCHSRRIGRRSQRSWAKLCRSEPILAARCRLAGTAGSSNRASPSRSVRRSDGKPPRPVVHRSFTVQREVVRRFPPTDRGIAALIDDLDAHALLNETLIVVCGDRGLHFRGPGNHNLSRPGNRPRSRVS